MEEITMSVFEMLTSYGALGAVTIYFMYKDCSLNKRLTAALDEFKIAIETMMKLGGVSSDGE